MRFHAVYVWLLLVMQLLFSACVSKGKYLAVLEQAEAAKSELSRYSADLESAISSKEEQRLVIAGLAAEVQQLRESAQEHSTAALGERQQLGTSLASLQRQLNQQQKELEKRNATFAQLTALLKDEELRFQRIRARLSEATSALPVGQYRLQQAGDVVELMLDEVLLFGGKKNSVSAYGDEVLTRIAAALGGQPDLRISILASPKLEEASQANALGKAAIRAGIVAENLTLMHGLSPKLVTAGAQEDDLVIVDGAPAESIAAHRFSISVRLDQSVRTKARAILKVD